MRVSGLCSFDETASSLLLCRHMMRIMIMMMIMMRMIMRMMRMMTMMIMRMMVIMGVVLPGTGLPWQ